MQEFQVAGRLRDALAKVRIFAWMNGKYIIFAPDLVVSCHSRTDREIWNPDD